MERLQSSTAEWHAYVAGFFDGEGSVSIARVRVGERSDYHKIVVQIGQRSEHAIVLERIAADFGGIVSAQMAASRVNRLWASYSKWQLQKKTDIRLFLLAMQPYAIVKARQIAIGLEFIDTFRKGTAVRDSLGRINGKVLSRDEIEARERLRLALREANELGPPHIKPSTLPALDAQLHLRTDSEALANAHELIEDKRHWRAKLEPDHAVAIITEYAAGGVTMQALADRYGVCRSTICFVIHRATHKRFTNGL